jgi:hypothetical protein
MPDPTSNRNRADAQQALVKHGGVFAVHRGIWDHPMFPPEPFTQREAWLWLISSAAWKEKAIRVDRRVVQLKRGQFCYSVRFLAEAWKWPKSKVHRFLGQLKNAFMIFPAKSGTVSETVPTIYSISNYNKFQIAPLPKRDSQWDSGGTVSGTNKKH